MIKAFLLDNLGIKLVSLAVALALSVYVRGEKTASRSFKVQVQYVLDEDRVLTSPRQDEVTVRFEGPETLLSHLTDQDLPVLQVDLAAQKSERYCFEYAPSKNLSPTYHSLKVEDITPNCIDMILEEKLFKDVRVEVDVTGTQAEGYSLGQKTATPIRVKIEGARSALLNISEVRTVEVPISGATENILQPDVRLIPPFSEGAHVWFVGAEEPTVSVEVSIDPRFVEETIPSVKIVTTPSLDARFHTLSVKDINVSFYGPKHRLDELKEKQLRVELDMSNAIALVTTRKPFSIELDTSMVKLLNEAGNPQKLPEGVIATGFRPDRTVKLFLIKAIPPTPTTPTSP